MFYRARKWLNRRRFDAQVQDVFNTPPVPVVDAPWTFLSMLYDPDVAMYLLAMKSLYTRIGRGRIVALLDRKATDAVAPVLAHHFPGIEFRYVKDVDPSPCQEGGCWERFLSVVAETAERYTIQVDCDTLTVSDDVAELKACLEANRSFTLSAYGNPGVWTLARTAESGRANPSGHCTVEAERRFADYPGGESRRYIRGSAGFAGFARGGFSRDQVVEFHETMRGLMGDRWLEWGTEQVASNWAVANAPDPLVLPFPKYANFSTDLPWRESSFLHFIGSYRFDDNVYARLGQREIARLKRL